MWTLAQSHSQRSCIINALFSFGFTYAAFHGAALISGQALIFDAIPQSFFVGFFAVFPATLITRRQLAKGAVTPLDFQTNRLPQNAFLRSVSSGIIVLVFGVAVHYLVFGALYTESLSLGVVLLYKTLYGIAITLVITPFALKCALSEYHSSPQSD